ncbi:hypothetical protein Tco_0607784 [Tanacetum coccineum]
MGRRPVNSYEDYSSISGLRRSILYVIMSPPSRRHGRGWDCGRDTVQLETTVSTISQEYLLEFTSEYGISEGLHPELPGREDRIVDFLEGKVGVYTKFFEFSNFRIPISQFLFDILCHYQIHLSQLSVIGTAKVDEKVFPTVMDWHISALKDGMPVEGTRRYLLGDDVYPTFLYDDDREMDLFNLISAPNPAAVKIRTRSRAAHEVPLLTTTASRVIDMENVVATSTSSGTPSTMEKSPLDFSNEDPSLTITNRGETENPVSVEASQEDLPAENTTTTEVVPEVNLEKEVSAMGSLVNKRRRKRDKSEMEVNTPPKVLRTDHASVRLESMTRGGKSLAIMGVGADTPSPMPVQQSVSDPDPLSYAWPQPTPEPFDVSRPAPSTFGGKSFALTGLEAGFTLYAPASQGTPAGTIDPNLLSFTEPQPAPARDIAE